MNPLMLTKVPKLLLLACLWNSITSAQTASYQTNPGFGHRAVVLGDSVSIRSSDDHTWTEDVYFDQAIVRSKSNILLVHNAGIGANTTEQMLSRLDSDVIAYKPDICFILGGTADTYRLSAETTYSNLKQIVSRLKGADITPFIGTLSAQNDNEAASYVARVNWYIHKIAEEELIGLVDLSLATTDPITGNAKPGYLVDMVHPSVRGARAMAETLVPFMERMTGGTIAYFTSSAADPFNLVIDGLFQSTNSEGTLSTSWTANDSSAATYSIQPVDDPDGSGNWQTISKTVPLGDALMLQDITTGFRAGDRISFSGKVKSSGVESGGLRILAELIFTGTNETMNPIYLWQSDFPTSAGWYMENVIPPGTTSIRLAFGGVGGTGVVQFSQIGVVNLSASELPSLIVK